MIIFFHGTEDDDTKPENWMSGLSRLLSERFNESVLVIPGVASGQQAEYADRALDFIQATGHKATRSGWHMVRTQDQTNPSLDAAMQAMNRDGFFSSSSEIALNIPQGIEWRVLQQKIPAFRDMGSETYKSALGIKPRITAATCAALNYVRRGGDRPVRIIGHSRGGISAIGTHNLLSKFGVFPTTLTLDPCHGVSVFGTGVKDYYTKAWYGTVVNIPAKKSVGFDSNPFVSREPIVAAANSVAQITSYPAVEEVKHGHMGKLVQFEQNKEAQRRTFRQRIDAYIAGLPRGTTMDVAIANFFDTFGKNRPDQALIYTNVWITCTQNGALRDQSV